jgi:hypothetical protein
MTTSMKAPAKLLFLGFTIFNAFGLASAQAQPRFREVFHFDLGDYWCENHLTVADFDRDGWDDIVLVATGLRGTNGQSWDYKCRAILLHNEADGTFTDSNIADYPNSHYGYFAGAADLNRDGAPDLILRESAASHVLLNGGSGRSFHEVFAFRPGYYGLAFVDANQDGFPDLVSGTQTDEGGLIELFVNDGTGTNFTKTWQSRLYGVALDSIGTVLSVNLNNDGRADIAARETYSGLLVTLHGVATGATFVEQNVLPLRDRTFALAAGNINKDSLTDLVAYVGWGKVRVFVNQGNGPLVDYWQSSDLGEAAFNVALADFDQDGFDDIFVGTFGDGQLRIYRNNLGASFDPWWHGSLPGEGYTGTAADLNGDGYADLIVGEKNSIRLLLNCVGIPKVRGIAMAQGLPTVKWNACKGNSYRVQCKDSLVDERWIDLNGDVLATGFTASKADGTINSSRQRFYRIIELPDP